MQLSIIVPVYNVATYVAATIESILAQTFTDFELLLVDDGSTDGSHAICEKYAVKDSRIRVITQSNRGVSSARNKGIKSAHGEIIGFVDSDDLIDPEMYQTMIECMKRYEADIVQCRHDRLEPKSIYTAAKVKVESCKCIDGKEFVTGIFNKHGSDYTNQVSLCTKIFKKEFLYKIRFPEGQTYEDEQETYKACYFANRIALIDNIFYHYIKRDNSIITGISSKKMLDKQKALYDRLVWLPPRMSQLSTDCFNSFINYSKHIVCRLWLEKDAGSLKSALNLMFEAKTNTNSPLNIYDRIYLRLLRHNLCKRWILGHEFVPIQKLISKFK